ncbi:MAG: penicillin-binding transpeptidase domain-containing protein, partial [Chromatiales bacterium]
YTAGYRVYTTLDSRLQRAANPALRTALDEYDRRHGYRGPERHYDLPAEGEAGDWSAILDDHGKVGELLPALVLSVEGKSAQALVKGGETVTLDWEGLSWARPLLDENRRGPAPKTAADILHRGDLIRVRRADPEGSGESGAEGTWQLAQIPAVEGALVSLDPDDGAILAVVGGYDFFRSKFNRVTQAERQPGSGFKPFIYSAALEAGFTPASLINDAPVVFADPSLEGAWRPENYSGKFFGPTRLRVALKKSRNLVSIRVLRAVGIERALKHIARFGFDPEALPRNLSLALGTANVTPLQQARGFAVLANGGYLVDPYLIERIELAGQGTVYEADPLQVCQTCEDPSPPVEGADSGEAQIHPLAEADAPRIAPRAISPENYYVMNSMMRDVIQSGTGVRARVLGRADLAGKTGTTNDQRDAWFNGFHPSLVAVVWVGFDDSSPLGRGETGGRAALPAWIAYMREALAGVPEELPSMPPGMVTVRIDPDTGRRAPAGQTDAIFEIFRSDNVPGMSGSAQTAGPARGGDTGVVENLF